MAKDRIQKQIYFTSQEKREYIEKRIDEIAKKYHSSKSFIMEQLLIKVLQQDNNDIFDIKME